MAKKPPPLNPEDAAAFTDAIGKVKPVKRKARVESDKPVIPAKAGIQPHKKFVLDSRLRGNDTELALNTTSRVDAALARKLKRGEISIEARLDLHGCTQEQAITKLLIFLEHAITSGKRCVCVVTGKGSGIRTQDSGEVSRPSAPAAARSAQAHLSDSSREGGVLKNSLPHWLNLPHINPHILMFTHAQPKDGGTGAFYILLRKH